LLELALALGYRVIDQRWRARARFAGADPETFLPERDASLEASLRYCRAWEVRTSACEKRSPSVRGRGLSPGG
jgi:hypothetical protein